MQRLRRFLAESRVYQLYWLLLSLLALGVPGMVEADGGTAVRELKDKDGVLHSAHMTFPRLDIEVGLTRLKDVRAKLGPSKMPRGTDGNDDVCYVSTNPEDRTLLALGTHDYVGRDLLAVANLMAEKTDYPQVALCGHSPLISKDLMTKSGLSLGLTKDQVKTILGPDAGITGLGPDAFTVGNYVAVDYSRLIVAPFPLKKDKGKSHCYFLFTTAEARFVKDRVVEVSIEMHEEGASPTCEGYDQ